MEKRIMISSQAMHLSSSIISNTPLEVHASTHSNRVIYLLRDFEDHCIRLQLEVFISQAMISLRCYQLKIKFLLSAAQQYECIGCNSLRQNF